MKYGIAFVNSSLTVPYTAQLGTRRVSLEKEKLAQLGGKWQGREKKGKNK